MSLYFNILLIVSSLFETLLFLIGTFERFSAFGFPFNPFFLLFKSTFGDCEFEIGVFGDRPQGEGTVSTDEEVSKDYFYIISLNFFHLIVAVLCLNKILKSTNKRFYIIPSLSDLFMLLLLFELPDEPAREVDDFIFKSLIKVKLIILFSFVAKKSLKRFVNNFYIHK